ncbi:MAG TPA: M13 family metallopeptidase [Steroidobacteraceae bacterium]|nr:M13 family metallopeptidase [Steroidobacteraceae bacterium]
MRMHFNTVTALCLASLCCAVAYGEGSGVPAVPAAQPLQQLPYIPSLDVASMDRSADACTDFYQYACGGWMTHNPIPADQARWSVYGKLYQDNQQFLWGILDGLAHAGSGRSADEQKIGDYFASCMDIATIERRGATPLAPALARIAQLHSAAELPDLLARLHLETGSGEFLFGFGSNQDFADSGQVIAFAFAGGLGMPDRDYYTDRDQRAVMLRRQYREHLARTFVQLGDTPAAARQHAATVLRLETRLARASLTRVERRDPYNLFHKMDRAALERLTPHFDWNAYLQGLDLAGTDTFNVTEPRFYRALDELLATTPLAELRTYLRWHAAHAAAPYLASAFEDERFAFFDHTLRGVPAQKPRWKRCVGQVDALLGEALGKEFVARAFGPPLKEATLTMTRQIEQAMRQDIEGLAWMSEPTRRQALAKLDVIVNKIGYPDHWRDYSAVVIDGSDYFGNVRAATEFESRRQVAKIGKPLDRSEWLMTPQTVNAYFDSQMNDINFPAGVLQPPLYDPRLDDAPNYGDTGGTIGHELTHGFDDEGRKFDAAGNLKDWWTEADARQFDERTQCIVDQYAKYVVVDDIHINSRLTLGEDVADLGGLILAHMAWRAQTAGTTPADRDGLTPEQRFFVGYAQWACENDRPQNERLAAKTDPHSPGRYRVNGLVTNMPEFAQAFACPTTAALVKKNPCRVW